MIILAIAIWSIDSIPLFSLTDWPTFNFASFPSAFCINYSTKVGLEAEYFHFELLVLAHACLSFSIKLN